MERLHMSGIELGLELCRALGIDSGGVTSIVIDCGINGAATLTVKRYLKWTDGDAIRQVIDRYELVKPESGDEGVGAIASPASLPC